MSIGNSAKALGRTLLQLAEQGHKGAVQMLDAMFNKSKAYRRLAGSGGSWARSHPSKNEPQRKVPTHKSWRSNDCNRVRVSGRGAKRNLYARRRILAIMVT